MIVTDPLQDNRPLLPSRRFVLKALTALPFLGYGFAKLPAVKAADLDCTLAPQLTEGPYWVDENLNRSDITTDTTRASVLDALPLALTIRVYDANGNSCGLNPVANVQIDIWHADAAGEYSDSSGNGQSNTVGQTFLRGYQVTDGNGTVTFKTIYPGWYSGRTTHIHLRARTYDANGNTTYNFTTQLFFDDSVTDSVYTLPPYNSRSARNTRNSNDMLYQSAESPLLLNLSLNSTSSASGEVTIGLADLPETVLSNTFNVTTSTGGTATIPLLTSILTVASADVGSTGNIYVAAVVNGTLYFNNGQTWVLYTDAMANQFPAFYSGTLNSSHSLVILSDIDISGLGTVNFYVGYGADTQDMLQNNRYQLTYTLS